MTAWGKTGRVEVADALTDTAVNVGICRVLVDGAPAGMIWPWGGRSLVSLGDGWVDEEPATRDEAVMWVLRRARPDVWREERGEVWRVQVGTTEFPLGRWHIHHPTATTHRRYGCTSGHFDSTHSWESALSYALMYARRMPPR